VTGNQIRKTVCLGCTVVCHW